MITGLYTAATGMAALEDRQDILANNIANSATPGFKRLGPVNIGFYQTFSQTLRRPVIFGSEPAPGGGMKLLEAYPDLAQGVLSVTGNRLDVALQGPGYFVVETPRGERFTRGGSFAANEDGELVTHEGYRVMGAGGPINVGEGRIVIGTDGAISAGGEAVGQLRMVEFEQPQRLTHEGGSLFAASEEVLGASAPAEETQVMHEQLEMSNVQLAKEMTSMVLGMRAYEANQKVIEAFDGSIGRLIEQVGMPQ